MCIRAKPGLVDAANWPSYLSHCYGPVVLPRRSSLLAGVLLIEGLPSIEAMEAAAGTSEMVLTYAGVSFLGDKASPLCILSFLSRAEDGKMSHTQRGMCLPLSRPGSSEESTGEGAAREEAVSEASRATHTHTHPQLQTSRCPWGSALSPFSVFLRFSVSHVQPHLPFH